MLSQISGHGDIHFFAREIISFPLTQLNEARTATQYDLHMKIAEKAKEETA